MPLLRSKLRRKLVHGAKGGRQSFFMGAQLEELVGTIRAGSEPGVQGTLDALERLDGPRIRANRHRRASREAQREANIVPGVGHLDGQVLMVGELERLGVEFDGTHGIERIRTEDSAGGERAIDPRGIRAAASLEKRRAREVDRLVERPTL